MGAAMMRLRRMQLLPTFYTDSPCLREYLQSNRFIGEGHMSEEEGLHILFFEI